MYQYIIDLWKIAQSVRRTPGTQNMTIFNRDAKSLEKACVSHMFSYFCLEKQMFAITNHLNSPPPNIQPNMAQDPTSNDLFQFVNLNSSWMLTGAPMPPKEVPPVQLKRRLISLVDITSPNSPNYPTRASWGFGGLVFSSPIGEIKWNKSSPSSWDITEPVRMKLMKWFGAMTMVHLAHRWKKRAPSFHRFCMDVSLPCRCPTAVVPLSAPEVLRRPRGASTELDSPSAAAKAMCRRYNAPAPYGSFIVRTSAR